jgi:hypothetical protein
VLRHLDGFPRQFVLSKQVCACAQPVELKAGACTMPSLRQVHLDIDGCCECCTVGRLTCKRRSIWTWPCLSSRGGPVTCLLTALVLVQTMVWLRPHLVKHVLVSIFEQRFCWYDVIWFTAYVHGFLCNDGFLN